MIIDFHTHCFPDGLAPKAIPKLSHAAGGLIPCTDGTLAGLRKSMKDCGVDVSVVMNIATNADQMRKVNDFAASINNREDIFSFGSVFPFAPDALDELERIKVLGLRGIKFHPEYQGFSVDDERLFPLYQKISELGLITLFHAGVDYGFAPPYGATPEKLAVALREFSSPVIAAHWGGVLCGEGVLKNLCGLDIYFDLSFGYGTMSKYLAEEIVEKHGADKLLFASDTPWHSPALELSLIGSLGLSDDELSKIKSENAKKLLGI